MNNVAIDWFNEHMGAGTLITIIIFLVSFISSTVVLLRNFSKKIKEETLKEEEIRELKESVHKLVSTFEKLSTQVNEINTHEIDGERRCSVNIETLSRKINDNGNKIDNVVQPKINEMETHINSIEQTAQLAFQNINNYNRLSIKAFIMSEYYKWMDLGYIDVYILSIIEEQFNIYDKVYHANTFVLDAMQQIRKLPPKPAIVDKYGNDPITYFERHPERDPRIQTIITESSESF